MIVWVCLWWTWMYAFWASLKTPFCLMWPSLSCLIDCVRVLLTCIPLWLILCCLPGNGRNETKETVKSIVLLDWLCSGFTDMYPLVAHFVLSPREWEKWDKRDSKEYEREGQGRKRNRKSKWRNRSKNTPLHPYLLQGQQAFPNCEPISVGCPGDVRYTKPLHHPTTLFVLLTKLFWFFFFKWLRVVRKTIRWSGFRMTQIERKFEK